MAKGKLVLKGTIELLSPTLVGCGRDERTDVDLLRDKSGKPFIPATSLVGVLKNMIKLDLDKKDKDNNKNFWGYSEENDGQQSSICCSDLFCVNDKPETVVRDGIKIDTKTGITEAGAKYDYEVIERGQNFNLHMEIDLPADENAKEFNRKMAATICDLLKNKEVKIGAKTNSGLGKIELINVNFHEFDFSEKIDVLNWLKRKYSTVNSFCVKPFDIKSDNIFFINTKFSLKSSFISRSYSAKPGDPDAISLKSGDDFIISGTSLKGAIRSRAERIVKTLGKSRNILNNLFGHVDTDKKSKNARKGRIMVDEVILPAFPAELQTRIKIDRFTGGTIETALFDSMPLFSGNDEKQVLNVAITIRDFKSHEAGLILLVLKDLWTGDLAIGGEKNVGRGALKGLEANIIWEDENGHMDVTIKDEMDSLSAEDKKKLNKFVEDLNTEEGEGQNER